MRVETIILNEKRNVTLRYFRSEQRNRNLCPGTTLGGGQYRVASGYAW